MANSFYAVKHGRSVGIFSTWEECSKSINKFSSAAYKKFDTLEEAEAYLRDEDLKLSTRFDSEEEVFASLGNNEALAYVDGSNLGDGSAFSWGSYIFIKDEFGNKEIVELSEKSTNKDFIEYRNIAGELFASALTANLIYKKGVKKLTIYHDYSGIRHWALGEWKTKNNLSQFYKRRFEYLSQFVEFEFVKVKGHTGDRFNEKADMLAKKALGIKK